MKRIRLILVLLLASLLGLQGGVVYAQVKGSPVNTFNAMDYRYQHYDSALPRFADSLKFREKVYNLVGVGVFGDMEYGGNGASSMAGWNARIATGYRFTPVHAAELDLLIGSGPKWLCLGVDANYVMNLNNFALKRDAGQKLESMFIAGLSYRYAGEHAYGLNTGFRLQWNYAANASLYVEPKVNVLTSQHRTLITQPAVSVGFAFSYRKLEYSAWDRIKGKVALKTNLLYDAAVIPNVGVEVNLGKRFSLSADWMYSWWSSDKIDWYWRVYGGELAVRKWFGKKSKEMFLTGHHVGIYGQCFTYDFCVNGRGQIGGDTLSTLWDKPNYAAGVEYGYSLPIAKQLNLDFCLGVGYMGGEYKEYTHMDDCYVWQVTKSRHLIGPTKAEISLVWIIGR